MIDTGRNYLTVTTIKMALDAMAYTKLNVLHWHSKNNKNNAPTIPRHKLIEERGMVKESF